MYPNNSLSDGDFESTSVGGVPTGWSAANFVNFIAVANTNVWSGAHSLHVHYSTGLFAGNGQAYFQSVPTTGVTYSSCIFVRTSDTGTTTNRTVTLSSTVGSFTPVTTTLSGSIAAVSALNVALSGATSQQFFLNCSLGSAESQCDYYMDDAWVILHNGALTQAELLAFVTGTAGSTSSVRDPTISRIPGIN